MSKSEIIFGELKDEHIVQKSKPLTLMRTVPFSLGELKVLDTYISRINSHNYNSNTVVFTKAEYEKLMGLNNVDIRTLKKYTKSMLLKVVELDISDGGYQQFLLFTDTSCKKDEYGQYFIEMTCHEKSKILFFNIEKLGYLQYELKNILSLTSKYSYLLYLYLKDNRYRLSWNISITELRNAVFDLKDNEYYLNYKYFKRDILDKALNEVNKKTDITFKYGVIKRGTRVVEIRFILEKEKLNEKPIIEEVIEPLSSLLPPELEEKDDIDYGGELADLLGGCACDDEFTVEQVRVIQDLVLQAVGRYADNIKYCDYLTQQVHKMNLYDSKKKIKDRFSYLRKMIEKDI